MWTRIFREEGIKTEIFALDISPSMLKERSEEDFKIVGDMEYLSFKANSFDRVFFFAALHHVENTRKTLEEAKRVVRSGGHIVVVEPISLRLLLLGRDIEPVDETQFCFSGLYLLRVLQQIGLQVRSIYYQGVFQRILPLKTRVGFYRMCNKVDKILNAIPLLRKIGILGNKITIVAQKLEDTRRADVANDLSLSEKH